MRKNTGLIVFCIFLIIGCLAGFGYLATHDIFKTKETVMLTKSSETTLPPSESSKEETSAEVEQSTSETKDANEQLKAMGQIEAEMVDNTVEITFPAELMGDITQQQLDEAVAKDEGFISGTINEDGSVTYVMTGEKYLEAMNSMQQGIDESLQKTLDDPNCPHITSISHNETYSEYTVMCSSDDLNLTESMLALQLYMTSGMYFRFLPEHPDNVYVTYINETTGKTIYQSNAQELKQRLSQ